jgi:hypothetical protein
VTLFFIVTSKIELFEWRNVGVPTPGTGPPFRP